MHVLWPYFEKFPAGTKPFQNITPSKSLKTLRMLLCRLCVNDATADAMTSGEAMPMTCCREDEVCMKYSWLVNGVAAFMTYLDMSELEKGAVVEAHADESSSEDEDIDAQVCMRAKCLHSAGCHWGSALCFQSLTGSELEALPH